MNGVRKLAGWVFAAALAGIAVLLYPTYLQGQKAAAFYKIAQTKPPLSVSDVEKLVGQPSHIEHADSTGLTAEAYYYPNGDRDLKVVFVNGVVFHTDLVAAPKS